MKKIGNETLLRCSLLPMNRAKKKVGKGKKSHPRSHPQKGSAIISARRCKRNRPAVSLPLYDLRPLSINEKHTNHHKVSQRGCCPWIRRPCDWPFVAQQPRHLGCQQRSGQWGGTRKKGLSRWVQKRSVFLCQTPQCINQLWESTKAIQELMEHIQHSNDNVTTMNRWIQTSRKGQKPLKL